MALALVGGKVQFTEAIGGPRNRRLTIDIAKRLVLQRLSGTAPVEPVRDEDIYNRIGCGPLSESDREQVKQLVNEMWTGLVQIIERS